MSRREELRVLANDYLKSTYQEYTEKDITLVVEAMEAGERKLGKKVERIEKENNGNPWVVFGDTPYLYYDPWNPVTNDYEGNWVFESKEELQEKAVTLMEKVKEAEHALSALLETAKNFNIYEGNWLGCSNRTIQCEPSLVLARIKVYQKKIQEDLLDYLNK